VCYLTNVLYSDVETGGGGVRRFNETGPRAPEGPERSDKK